MRLSLTRNLMTHPGHLRAAAALLLACAWAPLTSAHQYWLAPARYDAPPGEPVTVRAFAGTGFRGEWKPWAPDRCVRFVARAARAVDLGRGAPVGEEAWARFAASDGGGAMLAYESNFVPIALTSDAFDEYLHEEGLTGPAEARRKSASRDTVRERYRRCAKTWLAGSIAARATAPVGLPLEIVPLSAPGNAATLPVRVLAEGHPLAGALVRAWRSPLTGDGTPLDAAKRDSVGMTWEARTGRRGEVTVPCSAAGEWLLSVVDMRPSRDPGAAEWESTWASLTFVRKATPRAAK